MIINGFNIIFSDVDLNMKWQIGNPIYSELQSSAVSIVTGQTLFAQIMDFLPWTTFQRIVTRYGGDYRIRTLRCTEKFRIMALAQLTYGESLRDIEA